LILPYVYKLTHRETGEFYIGYRAVNKVSSLEDIGFKYFSSSKKVEELGFENFNIEIIAEFFKPEVAYEFEQNLISENIKDPLCLNRNYNINGTNHYYGKFGTKMSQDQKDKLSKSRIGLKLSEEVKSNMKLKYDRYGKENPFYGKKHKNSTLNQMKQKLRIFSPSEEIIIYAKYKSGKEIKDIVLEYSDRIKSDKSIRKILRRFSIIGINCDKDYMRNRGNSINKIFSDEEEFKIFISFSCGLSRRKILEVYSDRCSKATINTIITKYNNKFNLTQGVVSP
jgi:hypothetical protein